MKRKIVLAMFFLDALFSGMIFNLYGSYIYQKITGKESIAACCSTRSAGNGLLSENGARRSGEVQRDWSGEEDIVKVKVKQDILKGDEENGSKQYMAVQVHFLIYMHHKESRVFCHQKKNGITAGDFFLYEVPLNYTLGEDFSSGLVRRGRYPIVYYDRIEVLTREYVRFVFTKNVELEIFQENVAGTVWFGLEEK